MELIRKLHPEGKQAYVASGPLVVDSTGKKFGKSEGNAIWLDPKKSSPFSVYQYFMNTNDEDVERFLQLLTLLPLETIEKIVATHQEDAAARHGQKELAKYVVTTIFGKKAANEAAKVTEILFAHKTKRMELVNQLSADEINALFDECGGFINVDQSTSITDLAVKAGLGESNGAIKKLVKQQCLFVNEKPVENPNQAINENDYTNGILLLRKGKKTFKVVKQG